MSSNETYYYPEQTAVSIHSLRKYHPNALVYLLSDRETFDFLNKSDSILKELCNEIIVVDMPSGLNQFQKSRYLKTSIRRNIKGDFLFIDSDTIITGSLVDIENYPCSIGMVKQQDSDDWSINNPHIHLRKYNIAHNLPENFNHGIEHFYNAGLILCRDNELTQKFYDRWHELWYRSTSLFNFHMDQSDLWITNKEFGNIVSELPGQYNCMAICYPISLRYLSDCKVFHYFSSSQHCKYLKIRNPEFLKSIRLNGIDKETEELIKNIRIDYLAGLYITPKEEIEHEEILVRIAKMITKRLPFFNKIINNSYNLYGNLISRKNK